MESDAPKPLKFIAPDDDDEIDESSIPAYVGATLHPDTDPIIPTLGKGKGRAISPDVLAPASGNASGSRPVLSGNIGSPATNSNAAGSRKIVGGVSVETRYIAYSTSLKFLVYWWLRCILQVHRGGYLR